MTSEERERIAKVRHTTRHSVTQFFKQMYDAKAYRRYSMMIIVMFGIPPCFNPEPHATRRFHAFLMIA